MVQSISPNEQLAREIEAIEINPTGGRVAARAALLGNPGLRGRVERVATAALVRCLDAVKCCNDGSGGVMEVADGNVIAKSACELLDRVNGRPATTNLQLTADMGSAPAGSEATWTPELIAAVQAQLDRAKAKLGVGDGMGGAVKTPQIEAAGRQIVPVGSETGGLPLVEQKRTGRPKMKKSAGAQP